MTIEILLDAAWVQASRFERTLAGCPDALLDQDMSVDIVVPDGCYIMADAGVRLLSYANQLSHIGKTVTLEFEAGEDGTMGYLDRMGFFDVLASSVVVLPHRPIASRATAFHGRNKRLVEIARISPDQRDDSIPRRLVDSLLDSVENIRERARLETGAFTIFGELISNVYEHADRSLDGFAVLQHYGGKRNAVKIAVSDSGKGIMDTIRPALPEHYPELVGCTEAELLVEMFNRGVSRHGDHRGSGLRASAMHALKFDATTTVRLPSCLIKLEPSRGGQYAATAEVHSGLPLIWGTHIAFDFSLDALT